jgi:phage gp46-like protein
MALMDLRLVYDPATRRCDHAFNGSDFEWDFGPVTPVLIALGCERRARPDDELPDVQGDFYTPSAINPKRGFAGDALDPKGRLTGSRLWVFQRRKQDEATRRGVESAVAEALDDFSAANALPMGVLVRWLRRNILGIKVSVGSVTLDLAAPIAQ